MLPQHLPCPLHRRVSMTAVPETSIEQLIDGYDALLFDAYGVLVHLRDALPGVPELIDLLNRIRKPYYLVSNDASKLPETATARFARFGLQVTADRIITSGLLLQHYFSEQGLDGIRVPCSAQPTAHATCN